MKRLLMGLAFVVAMGATVLLTYAKWAHIFGVG